MRLKKCPIDKRHKTFTSFIFGNKVEKIEILACCTCKKVWYAE